MTRSSIAIIGMAGRFPGARNLAQFWQNLRSGVESIRALSDEDLVAAGVSLDDLARTDYVRRASVLDDVPMFDAAFFGLSPRDASIMDPQHRHFLECAWEALEDAAHAPKSFDGSIGVFAGSGMNTYLIHNLLANRKLLQEAGLFQLKQTGNDKDVLATRVSYQFDLRGPSMSVQTACSTSLVAVHLACQSLLNFECDMALAGGVTIEIPHGQGYIYRDGEILSRDGHCRPFDAASTGTVFASGAGVVVLRRLEDALADGDTIRAIIRGSAINNDGARKVGYLAPSVEGQAEVIAEALEFAEVTADQISYVEAHGTGTMVGDPIEIRALTQAFRRTSQGVGVCAVGSLKSNVGHLDAAAGIASLIKTVLALEHAELPASLHFVQPNPHIDFAGSPFFVNSKLAEWPSRGAPRRAGVTSLGIGGTNAHLVLEEAPTQARTHPAKLYHLLTVSAKTEAALGRSAHNLLTYLDAHPGVSLADASWTLHVGRHAFPWRRAIVVDGTNIDSRPLASYELRDSVSGFAAGEPRVIFLFSGQGSQYVGMGRELYEHAPVFREHLDRCADFLLETLGQDLRTILYPAAADGPAMEARLNQTAFTQPALFAVEYSLAQWWMSLGIKPAALLGHSIGEYVAACLAGVFTLEDALMLVAVRGRLMQAQPAGAMLAVSAEFAQVALSGGLSLAAINSPDQCVVSGPVDEIARLEQNLTAKAIAFRRLSTSHAFHSAMMEPMLGAFESTLRSVSYRAPEIPYLSNLTGTWITANEATDPAYWLLHLRNPVRFSDCLAALPLTREEVLVEVGPGDALATLAQQQRGAPVRAVHTLPRLHDSGGAYRQALQALGQLWVVGVNVDWPALHRPERPRRVPLPTYPFEHERFWIEPDRLPVFDVAARDGFEAGSGQARPGELHLYERQWQRAPQPAAPAMPACCWLLFKDEAGLADAISTRLTAEGNDVVLVSAGSSYREDAPASYTLEPGRRDGYDSLVSALIRSGRRPAMILHLWPVIGNDANPALDAMVERCFLSPLFLAQALGRADIEAGVAIVSNRLQQVRGEDVTHPARAVLLGTAKVMPQELAGIKCRSIDIELGADDVHQRAGEVLAEMATAGSNRSVAIRGSERFVEVLTPVGTGSSGEPGFVEAGGIFIITGGLGGVGLAIAAHLARAYQARLVLVGRSAMPPESQWGACLQNAELSEAERARIGKLVEIRASAGGLLVLQGDVTSLEQMRNVVSMTLRAFGKIDFVLHAAGVLGDGPLMLKTEASAARVLAPKVQGTLVLEEALRGVALRDFVLFSSISSIDPPAGQVDYAAANAFLDAFAQSRGGAYRVINWGAWRGVGMAAARESKQKLPLLDERLLDTPAATVDASLLSSSRHWVVREHTMGEGAARMAILPGTASIEMAAEGFAKSFSAGALEFRDVYFLAPLIVGSGEEREVRIQLKRDAAHGAGESGARFSVFSRSGEWVEHTTGVIAVCDSIAGTAMDPEAIKGRCRGRNVEFDAARRTRQERHLQFGPRWHSLRRLFIGDGEALAEIVLDERFVRDLSRYTIHPALLDLATGAAFYLTAGYEHCDDLFLPFAYKRLRMERPLPASFFSHIRARQGDEGRREVETFDITLFGEEGDVLAEIEGFSARRVSDPARALRTVGEASAISIGMAFEGGGERLIEAGARPGIDPNVGAREFVRILSARTPRNVVAVSEPLEELNDRQTSPVQEVVAAAEIISIGDAVEDTLAQWWREMLGVERAGLDDDFFDLGGHSLIAVRLLAKVRRTFRVDLDFVVLFDARSIRKLASLIRAAQPQPEV